MLELIMEISLLVILVMTVRKIFLGKISYKKIYALWLLVVLRLVIPVNFISTPISMWNVIMGSNIAEELNEDESINGNKTESEMINENSESFANDSKDTVLNESASNVAKDSGQKNGQNTGNNQESEQEQTNSVYEGKENQSLAKKDSVNQDTGVATKGIVKQKSIDKNGSFYEKRELTLGEKKVLHIIWLLGSAFFLLIIVVSNVSLYHRLKISRVFYGEREGIKIYQTESISTPCLYGFLQPAIYIPAFLVSSEGKEDMQEILSEEELVQIIAHEMVHYKHWDHIWAVVRVLIVSVYWFHPFLWLAAAFSKRDAEFACDESTVHFLGEEKRLCYGETLIKLAGSCSGKTFLYPMTSMSKQGKGLEKRIHALSEKKMYSKAILLPLIIFMLLVFGVTFSGAVVKQQEKVGKKTVENKNISNNSQEDIDTTVVENVETEDEIDDELEAWSLLYTNFLRNHAKDSSYQYYSIANLGEDGFCYVLLIAEDVNEIEEGIYGAVGCKVYNIVNQKVTLCGEISCSSSGEWVHIADGSDRRLMVDSHHSVTHVWMKADEDTLNTRKYVEETQKSGNSQYNIYNNDSGTAIKISQLDYERQVNEFYQSPSVVFYGNPYGEGKDKIKDSPDVLTDTTEIYAKYTKENEVYYVYEDLTGDGKDETIMINLSDAVGQAKDNTDNVKIYSGKTKKVIWSDFVNSTVHSGYNGIYLYLGKEVKRHPVILKWNPSMWQGIASYQWELFDLTDTGKVRKIDSDKIEFDLNHPKKSDIKNLKKYVKGLNRYLFESKVLISTYEQTNNLFGITYNQNVKLYDPSEEIQFMEEMLGE